MTALCRQDDQPKPPRPLEEIEKDISELEKEILAMLREVV